MSRVVTWDSLIPTRPWVEDLQNRIDEYTFRGDSINIWGLPAIGTSVQIRTLIKFAKCETIFAPIDTQWLSQQTVDAFFSLINSHLVNLCKPKSIPHPADESSSTYTRQLIHSITQTRPLCIIIDTIENLVPLNKSFFPTFKALRDEYMGHLNFIFVSNRPLYDHPAFHDTEQFIDFASHVEYVSLPFSDDEIADITQKVLTDYRRQLTAEEIKTVVPMAGGSLGILKNVLRVYDTCGTKAPNEEFIFRDHTILSRINRVLETCTGEERAYLYDLARNRPPKTKSTPFLKASGLIETGKIRGRLMNLAVLERCGHSNLAPLSSQTVIPKPKQTVRRGRGLSIDLVSGEIFKDGQRLPESLSKTEVQIILELQEHEGEVVTKEQIAEKMWGMKSNEKFSEWAIDKAISRIRSKIRDTKRPHRYLVTLKSRGFKLYTR